MAHRTEPYASKTMTARARALRQDAPIPERVLWGMLRGRRLGGLKFRRQVPIGPFVVDFLCEAAALVVELDGLSHTGRGEADDRRTAYLQSRGLRVFRVTNDQLIESPDVVAEAVLREAEKPSPQPSPRGRGSRTPSPQPSPEGRGGRTPSPQPSGEGRGGRTPSARAMPDRKGEARWT